MWNENEHPRDDDGKFTFKNGGNSLNTKESPADILYRDSKIKAEKDRQESEYKSKLLNILGDKAKPTDVLYGTTKELEEKVKKYDLENKLKEIPTGGAVDVDKEYAEKLLSTEENAKPINSLSKGTWEKPVNYTKINSQFNPNRYHPIDKKYKSHNGVDLKVPQGSPINIPFDGYVEFAGQQSGYGNVIVINHGKIDGKEVKTKYAHLSKINVQKGEKVYAKSDKKIGLSGGIPGTPGAGKSTGAHLHYEVHVDGIPKNPMHYIKY